MSALTCRSISPHLLKMKVFRIVRKIKKANSNWANFTSKNGRGFESRHGLSLFHLTEYAIDGCYEASFSPKLQRQNGL